VLHPCSASHYLVRIMPDLTRSLLKQNAQNSCLENALSPSDFARTTALRPLFSSRPLVLSPTPLDRLWKGISANFAEICMYLTERQILTDTKLRRKLCGVLFMVSWAWVWLSGGRVLCIMLFWQGKCNSCHKAFRVNCWE
jgi:hypothetical protein